MTRLIVKSRQPEAVKPEVQSALDNQRNAIQDNEYLDAELKLLEDIRIC